MISKDNTGSEQNRTVDIKHLASEKEEAKAVLRQFLKGLGLSTALSTRITKKAEGFTLHLMAMLHSRYHLRYVTGRELTTVEIHNTLLPYLEALEAEHGDGVVDVLVHFPDTPPPRQEYPQYRATSRPKTNDIHQSGLTMDRNFRPAVTYALSLGLTITQLQTLSQRFPSIAYYSPERKMKPVVDFFLALGITKPGIVKIFLKRPQIFGCSLEENLKPTMVYLESIGVERRRWARILVQFPALLTYNKAKLQEAVNFLHEVGLSTQDIGITIMRFPHVVSYSVEEKLRPTVAFLKGIGVKDIRAFIKCSPQVLGYSVEGNIKPTIRFLVDIGYSEDEVITIVNRFPQVLSLAINENIRPKWEFFADTGWPKSYIVAFPQYFGYSLSKRIKPRLGEVLKSGFCWTLSRTLSSSDSEFYRLLQSDRDRAERSINSVDKLHT